MQTRDEIGRYASKREDRIGEKNVNSQGCIMKIVEYGNAQNIVVEFQDEYHERVKTSYYYFINGRVRNPSIPSVVSVGINTGTYPIRDENGKINKEYSTWNNMLKRCFSEKEKERHKTYKDVHCCSEWLVYDNFYEWAISQSNYNLWKCGGNKWHLDKDIISKGSVYSGETCCLVPDAVNTLFNKQKRHRGDLPIGVERNGSGFMARCRNPFIEEKKKYLGTYLTPKEAFQAYKEYKEDIIKQVAQIEFDKGNITIECYNAMMNYEVEITD